MSVSLALLREQIRLSEVKEEEKKRGKQIETSVCVVPHSYRLMVRGWVICLENMSLYVFPLTFWQCIFWSECWSVKSSTPFTILFFSPRYFDDTYSFYFLKSFFAHILHADSVSLPPVINSLLNWIKFCIESSDAYARRKNVRVCVFMNWSEPPVDSIKMTHSVFLTALSVSQSPTLILGRELAPAALQQWWTNWTETWNNSFVMLLSLIWLLTFFSNPKPEFVLLHTHKKILLFHQGGLWSEKTEGTADLPKGVFKQDYPVSTISVTED